MGKIMKEFMMDCFNILTRDYNKKDIVCDYKEDVEVYLH